MTTPRQRLTHIDLAKGLAIFLVVLGHVVARDPPADNDWYVVLKSLVYEFHMPFFMFLSGVVFQVTFKPGAGPAAIAQYLSSRAVRLLPAFVLFALLIWAAKVLGGQFLHVDNAQAGGVSALLDIFVRPSASVATSLWYVYVLFQFYVLFALGLALSGGRLIPLVIAAAALHLLFQTTEVTTLFAAHLVCEFALFFALGALAGKHFRAFADVIKANALAFYSVFALSFLFLLFIPHPLSKAIIGLCSIPALVAFAGSFSSARDRSILLVLGEYTFTIYLMNTLFIGLFKGVMLKVAPWDGLNFLVFFPVLLAAGILGPVLAHRWVLEKIPLLGRLTK